MTRSTITTKRRVTAALLAIGGSGILAGCAGAAADSGNVNLDYWLWDSNQLPSYQRCIEAFEAENPDIDVRINQYGYNDYWQKITAGFVAGVGPDVFTDHLTRYPDYAERGLLLDLNEVEATANIDPGEFQEGLADLWTGQNGEQFGIPKDFDTIALFYDVPTIEAAGLEPEDLAAMTWNPDDGGTFEEVLAHLSMDVNGVRGDEEGFDPNNVETYGLASGGSGGASGQSSWSWLAGAMGWKFTDAVVWGDHYYYDDPRVQQSLTWLFGLVDKGYMPSFEEVGSEPQPHQALGSGKAAIAPAGSWMINTYAGLEGIELGIASVPIGPVGHPVSMYNGLADSISARTDHPAEAGKLVAFLGSDACQVIVGESAVVFPARPAGTEAAIEAFGDRGIDVTAFTDLVDNGYIVYFPVTREFAAISAILDPAFDEMYIGDRDPSTLTELNEQVNALLE